MAPHSSTLAWKIPWMEEPGGLQSMGSPRVGHDWATLLSLLSIGEGNGNPLQCSCLENPRDGGAWWAAVYGVAQSRTRLKRLSSSSNILTEEKLSSTDSKQAKADPRPGARGSSHLHLCSLYSCQCLLISFTLYILWTQEQKSEILELENSPSVY